MAQPDYAPGRSGHALTLAAPTRRRGHGGLKALAPWQECDLSQGSRRWRFRLPNPQDRGDSRPPAGGQPCWGKPVAGEDAYGDTHDCVQCIQPPGPLMSERFDFAFAASYRRPARLFGITPARAFVTVSETELQVRFGAWHLVSRLSNVTGAEMTGGFRWLKTAGPPHLSFGDRGVTFATNGERALCVSFRRPVLGIDPTGMLRHPGATLTVRDPLALQTAIERGRTAPDPRSPR